MFFLGVSASLIGAAARNIGLSPYQIGLLIAAQQVGFLLSTAISGALSDTHEKPRILLVGSLVLGLALLAFYRVELFWVNLVLMLLIGAGVGTYEGVTDALLLDIHTRRQSLHINVNHFFVTFGSIMITVYVLFLQVNWRQSVVQSGVIVLALAAFFGLARLERNLGRAEGYAGKLKALTGERTLVVLFVATTLAVGVELGSISFLTTYLMDLRAFTQVTSKIGLIVFLSGMALGRLLLGFWVPREQIIRYVLALLGLSSLCFTVLYFLNLGALTYPAILLAGISLSALLPLMITLAGLLYPDIAGTVLAIVKVAAGLGGILLPFFISVISKSLSFQAALLLFPAALMLAFFTVFLEIRHIRSPEAAPVV
jgi:MFS family permease